MTAIVSDATTLIILAKLGQLHLLKTVFSSVLIPSTVYKEIHAKADYSTDAWHDAFYVQANATQSALCLSLQAILDPGESEAIAMASETGYPLLIDEKKGRTIARSIGVPVIGMVGFLLLLNQKNILDKPAIISLLDAAIKIGFRLSNSLYQDFCHRLDN